MNNNYIVIGSQYKSLAISLLNIVKQQVPISIPKYNISFNYPHCSLQFFIISTIETLNNIIQYQFKDKCKIKQTNNRYANETLASTELTIQQQQLKNNEDWKKWKKLCLMNQLSIIKKQIYKCRNLRHSIHYYYLSILPGYKIIKLISSLLCINALYVN